MLKKIVISLCFSLCFALDVKYQGQVDTSNFKTLPIGKSSFVKEVMYDGSRVLIRLNNTWYMYCNTQDVNIWNDINASRVYLNYYKGKNEKFCTKNINKDKFIQ